MTDLLHQSVKANNPIPWHIRVRWARQIVKAVSFAHSNEVILSSLHLSYFSVDDQSNIKLIHIKQGPPSISEGWLAPGLKRDFFAHYKKELMPTKESDVFQLGLLLWLLTDFSATIPARNQKAEKYKVFWNRRTRPGAHLKRIIDLPPCQPHIPLYYQAIIKMCRQKLPSNRIGADGLLLAFPGQSLSSQSTAYYHQLVYGDTQNSPWIYPPPTDRLEDLDFDNNFRPFRTREVSEYVHRLQMTEQSLRNFRQRIRELSDDEDSNDDNIVNSDYYEDSDLDLSDDEAGDGDLDMNDNNE